MNWSKAWENEDLKGYISHYDPVKFHSPTHGKLSKYRAYKRAVFRGKGKPKVDVGHLTIFRENDYLKVSFSQHYQSERLNDIGEKTLFLTRDKNMEWKIIDELWRKPVDAELIKSQDSSLLPFAPNRAFFPGVVLNE